MEKLMGPYLLAESEKEAFGEYLLNSKATLEYGKPTLIARYPRSPVSGEGQAVDVYCTAMPARFYTIKAIPAHEGRKHIRKGFSLTTGSSGEKLAAQIAQAINKGMLGLT